MIHTPPIASTLKHEEPLPLPSGTQSSIGVIDGATSQQSKILQMLLPVVKPTGHASRTSGTSHSRSTWNTTDNTRRIFSKGNPSYDPATLTVKKGDKITVTNKDTLPHTVTSGTGPTDPNSAKQFDTSILEPATADIETTNINPAEYPFHCTIHPYMTGKLVVSSHEIKS